MCWLLVKCFTYIYVYITFILTNVSVVINTILIGGVLSKCMVKLKIKLSTIGSSSVYMYVIQTPGIQYLTIVDPISQWSNIEDICQIR